MTYQIWTKLIITSLILLGDSTAASEIRHRNNVEAVTIDSIVQISESHDDVDYSHASAIKGSNSIQNQVTRKYQTLLTPVYLDTSSYSYKLYQSRAPPTPL